MRISNYKDKNGETIKDGDTLISIYSEEVTVGFALGCWFIKNKKSQLIDLHQHIASEFWIVKSKEY